MNHPEFDNSEIISRYTRKQALEDGVLVDVSPLAREAGIRYPVLVTSNVFSILNDTSCSCQDLEGRTWDMLTIFKLHARLESGNIVKFAPMLLMKDGEKATPVKMWAQCGPGDDLEPVITIMLEDED